VFAVLQLVRVHRIPFAGMFSPTMPIRHATLHHSADVAQQVRVSHRLPSCTDLDETLERDVLRDVVGNFRRHSLDRELTCDALYLYDEGSPICAGDDLARFIEIAPE